MAKEYLAFIDTGRYSPFIDDCRWIDRV